MQKLFIYNEGIFVGNIEFKIKNDAIVLMENKWSTNGPIVHYFGFMRNSFTKPYMFLLNQKNFYIMNYDAKSYYFLSENYIQNSEKERIYSECNDLKNSCVVLKNMFGLNESFVVFQYSPVNWHIFAPELKFKILVTCQYENLKCYEDIPVMIPKP